MIIENVFFVVDKKEAKQQTSSMGAARVLTAALAACQTTTDGPLPCCLRTLDSHLSTTGGTLRSLPSHLSCRVRAYPVDADGNALEGEGLADGSGLGAARLVEVPAALAGAAGAAGACEAPRLLTLPRRVAASLLHAVRLKVRREPRRVSEREGCSHLEGCSAA